MQIPEYVRIPMGLLGSRGYEVYLVGGCVRDTLMGKKPNDYDLCTSAKPDEMLMCFAGYPTLENGKKHGTITVIVDRHPIEVTTYRVDGSYADHRHPEKVTFTAKLAEDLSRRDFTVNAMAWNEESGLVDLFAGKKHLQTREIVCVGEPDRRFDEDGLRILRALRFASVLGFTVREDVAASIQRNRSLLSGISAERIWSELGKLLCGIHAAEITAAFPEVLSGLWPEMRFSMERWAICASALDRLPRVLSLRIAAMLQSLETPSAETAVRCLRQMKADNRTVRQVERIFLWGDSPLPCTKPALRRMLGTYGYETVRQILALREALPFWDESGEIPAWVDAMEAANECISIGQLALNGQMLALLGVPKGKAMGAVLQRLLDAVMDEQIPNTAEALTAAVQEWMLKEDFR